MLQNVVDNTRSTIIRKTCPFCSKIATQKSIEVYGTERTIHLECGHSIVEYGEAIDSTWTTKSISGKEPFPFQYKTLDFIIESNFRTGIFHEQGVGKTLCSLLPVKRFPEKLVPFAVVCKASLKAQWFQEILDWTGILAQPIMTSKDKLFPELFKAFIISYDMVGSCAEQLSKIGLKYIILDECQQIKNAQAKRTQALRAFTSGKVIKTARKVEPNLPRRAKIQIIAEDLISYHGLAGRFNLSFEDLPKSILGLCECKTVKEGIIKGQITIQKSHAENDDESEVIETILHEIAHAITPGAGHKKIWAETSKSIGGNGLAIANCDGSIEVQETFNAPIAIVALSGTPIKNHAGEYFPVLNILHPEIFHSQAAFERDYLDTYQSGWSYKVGGINRYRLDEFKRLTDSWIIRYTRDEVLPDLPKIFRKNFFVELGEEVEAAYKKAYLDFKDEYLNGSENGNKFKDSSNLLAKLNRLRHITGVAKILPVSEFTREFLESSDRKLVLFVHHKDVGTGLYNHIYRITQDMKIDSPLQLTSDIAGADSGRIIDEAFKLDPNKRIMIASTLSAGEGKNWQMCQDAIIVERQWNPANEEQAEGRFPRPGSIAESISITYALALGTPDEYLAEIVERKREICKKTMGNEAVEWNQTETLKELSELLISKGGKRWSL